MVKESKYDESFLYKKSIGAAKVGPLPKCYTALKEVCNTGRVPEPYIFFGSLNHFNAFFTLSHV